jgi:hypothetical protein
VDLGICLLPEMTILPELYVQLRLPHGNLQIVDTYDPTPAIPSTNLSETRTPESCRNQICGSLSDHDERSAVRAGTVTCSEELNPFHCHEPIFEESAVTYTQRP